MHFQINLHDQMSARDLGLLALFLRRANANVLPLGAQAPQNQGPAAQPPQQANAPGRFSPASFFSQFVRVFSHFS